MPTYLKNAKTRHAYHYLHQKITDSTSGGPHIAKNTYYHPRTSDLSRKTTKATAAIPFGFSSTDHCDLSLHQCGEIKIIHLQTWSNA